VSHAAYNYESASSQVAAEAFRHLRAVKCRAAGSYNAERWKVQYLSVAANIEQDGRIVNLK
jgi:hypothetical protein